MSELPVQIPPVPMFPDDSTCGYQPGRLWVGTVDRRWLRADHIHEVSVAHERCDPPTAVHEAQLTVTLTGGPPGAGPASRTAVIARFPSVTPSAAHAAARELVDALVSLAGASGVLVVDNGGHVAHHRTAQRATDSMARGYPASSYQREAPAWP